MGRRSDSEDTQGRRVVQHRPMSPICMRGSGWGVVDMHKCPAGTARDNQGVAYAFMRTTASELSKPSGSEALRCHSVRRAAERKQAGQEGRERTVRHTRGQQPQGRSHPRHNYGTTRVTVGDTGYAAVAVQHVVDNLCGWPPSSRGAYVGHK